MYTKLTLRMDSRLIEQAKQYAKEHGSSLSQLVAEYFTVLTANDEDTEAFERKLPPITRSLVGVLKESEYDPRQGQMPAATHVTQDIRRHNENRCEYSAAAASSTCSHHLWVRAILVGANDVGGSYPGVIDQPAGKVNRLEGLKPER